MRRILSAQRIALLGFAKMAGTDSIEMTGVQSANPDGLRSTPQDLVREASEYLRHVLIRLFAGLRLSWRGLGSDNSCEYDMPLSLVFVLA